jgi:beta-xylosidase
MPGDYADPSVTKVGDTYWATATSSEWAPLYPLMRSTDLKQWETVGHVFPQSLPEWAQDRFWAPEIHYENGKTYIYYTARKKGGPLCVGVASATDPAGPYTDHGPLICQDAGAIDGFPIRDEKGQLYLVWKEDGNSRNLPTPLWAQRMNEERTALLGEKVELFRNDPNTWEGRLVEGPAIIRRGDYFYNFYAGDACCGRECTYAQGVARSRTLLGPWEKYSQNPILASNDTWKCPGHGTVITDDGGRYYFLYHAYSTDGTVYTGRQGLLSEFTWTADGWPKFYASEAQGERASNGRELSFSEEFTATSLAPTWQWPVGQQPRFSFQGEALQLKAQPEKIGSVLSRRTLSDDYVATTAVRQGSLPKGAQAGIAAIGDLENALGVSVGDNKILFWMIKGNKNQVLAQAPAPAATPVIQLRLSATEGSQFRGAWSTDGSTWNELKTGSGFVDGAYLPPWDRAVRVGVVAKGPASATASFDWFRVSP